MSLVRNRKNGFTIVEVLAAVAIIGVAVLGVGAILRSVSHAKLKNRTASQMIELESRVVRSLQNYNSFECQLPPATGAGTAKSALIAAVESTSAVGTVLVPLAGFRVPLITDGTPTASTIPPAVCNLPGFELALANDTGGKTYFDLDLGYVGTAAAPLNGSVFEILATIKCDGPPYNIAADTKKYCAMAYQIRVVEDPANPGRNEVNLIPIGTSMWNPAAAYPIKNSAADFNLAAGIGGPDYNFNLSTDVFRKVNLVGSDVVANANDCSQIPNSLFVTGYDRDSATVNCAKKPAADPGCAPDEVPIGLKYDVATGEVRTNCQQISRPVRCTDPRYVIQSVNLKSLDSRLPIVTPPGQCVWVGVATTATKTVSSNAETWIEADLCPKDYLPQGVGCTVTVNAGDTSGGSCTSYHHYVDHPYVCGSAPCGTYSCKNVPCPSGLCSVACTPGPSDPACTGSCTSYCPTYCSNYYCDATNTYAYGATTLTFGGTLTMISANRYRCEASSLPTQPCASPKQGDASCGPDTRLVNPTWNNQANFTFVYTCQKSNAFPNTMNANY